MAQTDKKKNSSKETLAKHKELNHSYANDGKTMQQLYIQKYMSDTTKMALGNRRGP